MGIVNVLSLVDYSVRRFELVVRGVEVFENSCKWKGKVLEVIGELKKLKVELRVLMVFKGLWLLVGWFLFWNRIVSLYLGIGLNLLDCLVFCDGLIVVCCIV